MKRKLFIFILLAAVITLSLQHGAAADNKETEQLKRMEAKLDQILLNQSEIFKRLDKIEQELAVVKVRATR